MRQIWIGIVNGMREIWAHKIRTFLAVIGIVLGVAALVSMVGVIEGMIGSTRQSFDGWGGIERITIYSQNPPQRQEEIAYRSPGLTLSDVAALRENLSELPRISGFFDMGWHRISGTRRGNNDSVYGVSQDYFEIYRYELESGRFIAAADEQARARVVVLGPYTAQTLFAGTNPLGKSVVIDNESYEVIGVIKEEFVAQPGSTNNALYWKFRRAFVPLTTALARREDDQSIRSIEIMVQDPQQLPTLKPQIENVIRGVHNGILDFRIETQEQQLYELNKLERNFRFSLGGIAAISLLVGGIGIMNVMLASVNERIREIGVRKAIGAQGSDIFIQFVCESLLISFIGCLFGMFTSLALIRVFQNLIPGGEMIESIPWDAMFVGFAFSTAVGLLSGLYPAIRAAILNPIDALRHE